MTKLHKDNKKLKDLIDMFEASTKDLEQIVVTFHRGKQVADSGDQYIVKPERENEKG